MKEKKKDRNRDRDRQAGDAAQCEGSEFSPQSWGGKRGIKMIIWRSYKYYIWKTS